MLYFSKNIFDGDADKLKRRKQPRERERALSCSLSHFEKNSHIPIVSNNSGIKVFCFAFPYFW